MKTTIWYFVLYGILQSKKFSFGTAHLMLQTQLAASLNQSVKWLWSFICHVTHVPWYVASGLLSQALVLVFSRI